ncbi:MAG: diacylglycerol kinase family protein [Planctomycetota bacterium]|jgi:diacylglycerol kinase (ATP)|nr:diacylglycerol kinase family protein [Planctomycetota bacterium]
MMNRSSDRLGSLLVLTNAGSRRASEVRQELEDTVAALDPAPRLTWREVTSTPEDPGPVDRVLIVGGDGTIHLALRWLEEVQVKAPAAIIPAGTGNNLARGLGIPTTPAEAIALAFEGSTTRKIDVVRYTLDGAASGWMLQVAALGFPAVVAGRFDRLRKQPIIRHPIRWLGDSCYRILAIVTLLGGRIAPFSWKFKTHDSRWDASGMALFLGNEGSIGGGFRPCPAALLDDGLLDQCLIPTLSPWAALKLFPKISRGTHLDAVPDIQYRQDDWLRIEQLSGPFLVDGDIVGHPEVIELEVLARHFEVYLPR